MSQIKRINPKTYLLLFVIFYISFSTQAQSVKGTVKSDLNEVLEFASVALLKPTDSVMVSFAYTDELGKFEINDVAAGDFLLQIYLTGFAPYYHKLSLQNKQVTLNSIVLKSQIQQLDEVTITAVVPVQIKKDTIAYNAGSFKIHHDDTIEDLLKKLPGIELDTDGSIKAQGNAITKVYVDGKEFFSGDPSIVLKNLSADAINKIGVIDKKSEEAELTGVNDDQRNYVINLTLKKNKKKRGFGKLAAGTGLDKKYFADLNYNRFSNKTQLSLIGKTNDINITGSNIQDFLDFSGGISDDSEGGEEGVNLSKKGLSGQLTTRVVGVNYGHELQKKEVISGDYFYNYLDNSGTSTTKRLSFFKAKNHKSESVNENATTSENHQLNFSYENKSSREKRLFIRGSMASNERFSSTSRNVSYFDDSDELKTISASQYNNNNKRDKGNISMNYFHKLDNSKRNFGLGMFYNGGKNRNFREQHTENETVSNQRMNKVESLKNELFKNNNLNLFLHYTEPLADNHFLKIQSNFISKNVHENTNQQRIQNDIEKPLFSYNLKNKEENFNTTLTYNYNTAKFVFLLSSELQNMHRSVGLVNGTPNKTKHVYFNPKVSIRLRPKKGKSYLLNYRKRILSPGAYQSSPVLNDINPFYLKQGNPNLVPQEIDNVVLNINLHNYQSSQSFYSKINYQHINNAIIPSLVIDDNFVKTRSFENYGSQNLLSARLNYNKRIKSMRLRYNLKTSGKYKTSNSIIDQEVNDVISKEYIVEASIENDKKNVIDTRLGFSFQKNFTDFSVQQDLNRNYVNQKFFSQFDYDFSKRLNFNTQFEYLIYTDSNFKTDQRIPLWNSSISCTLTKNKNGIVKLLVIDMLNKNVDITKRSTVNFFEETTNEMLGRYFIMSFTYRLNSTAKNKKPKKNLRRATAS